MLISAKHPPDLFKPGKWKDPDPTKCRGSGEAEPLCCWVCAQRSSRAYCRHNVKPLCPEVAELRRNLGGKPSKMTCVGWREPVLLVERDGQGCSLLLRPTPPHHLSDSKPWDYFCQQLNDFHPIKVHSVPSGNGALRPRYS